MNRNAADAGLISPLCHSTAARQIEAIALTGKGSRENIAEHYAGLKNKLHKVMASLEYRRSEIDIAVSASFARNNNSGRR